MRLFVILKKRFILFILAGMMILGGVLVLFFNIDATIATFFIDDTEEEVAQEIQRIFKVRTHATLKEDQKILQNLYDREKKYGVWAYEHELKKMKYLHQWSQKQGIKFTDITPHVVIKWIKEREEGFRVNLVVSSAYQYVYENEPEAMNMFRIGTYHSLDIHKIEDTWKITREWYTDPFADSLHLDEMKTNDVRAYILSQKSRSNEALMERRKKAVEYADRYCGAAAEKDYAYNKKYRNYNPQGGDCANFASQILHEGGNFKKTYTWNYNKGGSKAWVNAQAFKNYMIYSGRASVVAYGTYDKVYKAAYKLLPGDFVAYEKKGKITHISVVTGSDTKGYTLVNSHNTDRYRVPWDLGWNDKGIKFWLVHVHF